MKNMRKLEVVLTERRYWNNELMRHYNMVPEGCENKDRVMYFSSRIKELDLELKKHNYTGKLMKVA